MKRLALILAIICFATAQADIKFTHKVLDADSVEWQSIAMDTLNLGAWPGLTLANSVGSGLRWTDPYALVPKANHDTLIEYVSRIDTVIELYEILCDTIDFTFEEYITDSGDTTIEALWSNILCDTIFRVHFVDIWSPKMRVYLTPDQYAKLMELLR